MSSAAPSRGQVYLKGLSDVLPIVVGATPFGLITGVASAALGLSAVASTAASVVIFAGASQLAVYDLMSQGAPALVVVTTAVIINLRFLLYSAAIAPLFAGESRWNRLLYSYLLTDQAYALTAARSLNAPAAPHTGAYYLGCASGMWFMWITATFVGAYAGAAVPASWSLDFAVPLCFLALLIPSIRDRAQVACAVFTAIVALVAQSAPQGSGTIVSILLGTLFGVVVSRRFA